MDEALLRDVMKLGGDIIDSERFAMAREVPHHSKSGDIALHSLETACYALQLARWLSGHGVVVDEADAVRASLLHDIGMTEVDVFLSPPKEGVLASARGGAYRTGGVWGERYASGGHTASHVALLLSRSAKECGELCGDDGRQAMLDC